MQKCFASEINRQKQMWIEERRLQDRGFQRIAGVDEAGRGPLAGPVVAASCILPKNSFFEFLNDSKQLTPKKREVLFEQIVAQAEFGIGIVSEEKIDQINILQATMLAMQQAVNMFNSPPDALLIDGNQIPSFPYPTFGLVRGDERSLSIAAASILAKVTRDRIMIEMDMKYPGYGFKNHKGYATVEHLAAIQKLGSCAIHRKSFAF